MCTCTIDLNEKSHSINLEPLIYTVRTGPWELKAIKIIKLKMYNDVIAMHAYESLNFWGSSM